MTSSNIPLLSRFRSTVTSLFKDVISGSHFHKVVKSNTRSPNNTTAKALKLDNKKSIISQEEYFIRPIYLAPRYPIALCHGLFGFDTIGPQLVPNLQIHYWRGIPEALQQLGARVVITKVSSIGSIHDRALALDEVLKKTLSQEHVNLIGHSMGGLDARYLVTHLKPQNYTVSSITTIGTPHRGSSFMDFCRDYTGLGTLEQKITEEMEKNEPSKFQNTSDSVFKFSGQFITPFLRWHRFLNYAKSWLDYPAYSNLTTDYLIDHFNPNTPNHPDVKYYSYAGDPEKMSIFSPLRGPWEVIRSREGPNDGLVSVNSAKWGEFVETVPANHLDLSNVWKPQLTSPSFDPIEFYLRMATFLNRQGF
ncbi:hypothetical protein K7432_012359 [Basidiobolus ranarum]|uniref:GPI inositol-deacylase n=1 Tax=Basidiobolus ranarum TaxID=34480 RepID=A0ABR2VSC2_9FUNG